MTNRETYQNVSRLSILFRNAHALVKNSRPVSDFKWLCDVDQMKNVDIGPTYRNDKSCKEFIVAMAEVERSKIEKAVREAPFVCIMSDGSTDVSTIENEMVYIQLANHGKIQCFFLGCIECETSNAIGIYDAIKKSLNFDGLSTDDILKKVVAFVGDGASVNTREMKCPNVLMVVDLLLSLLSGSSECERGFSKIIKSNYRNKMRSTTLTMLMTIQLHSEEINNFNPDVAIAHWNRHGHRRPSFMVNKCRKRNPVAILDAAMEQDAGQPNPVLMEKENSHYDSDFSDFEVSEQEEV